MATASGPVTLPDDVQHLRPGDACTFCVPLNERALIHHKSWLVDGPPAGTHSIPLQCCWHGDGRGSGAMYCRTCVQHTDAEKLPPGGGPSEFCGHCGRIECDPQRHCRPLPRFSGTQCHRCPGGVWRETCDCSRDRHLTEVVRVTVLAGTGQPVPPPPAALPAVAPPGPQAVAPVAPTGGAQAPPTIAAPAVSLREERRRVHVQAVLQALGGNTKRQDRGQIRGTMVHKLPHMPPDLSKSALQEALDHLVATGELVTHPKWGRPAKYCRPDRAAAKAGRKASGGSAGTAPRDGSANVPWPAVVQQAPAQQPGAQPAAGRGGRGRGRGGGGPAQAARGPRPTFTFAGPVPAATPPSAGGDALPAPATVPGGAGQAAPETPVPAVAVQPAPLRAPVPPQTGAIQAPVEPREAGDVGPVVVARPVSPSPQEGARTALNHLAQLRNWDVGTQTDIDDGGSEGRRFVSVVTVSTGSGAWYEGSSTQATKALALDAACAVVLGQVQPDGAEARETKLAILARFAEDPDRLWTAMQLVAVDDSSPGRTAVNRALAELCTAGSAHNRRPGGDGPVQWRGGPAPLPLVAPGGPECGPAAEMFGPHAPGEIGRGGLFLSCERGPRVLTVAARAVADDARCTTLGPELGQVGECRGNALQYRTIDGLKAVGGWAVFRVGPGAVLGCPHYVVDTGHEGRAVHVEVTEGMPPTVFLEDPAVEEFFQAHGVLPDARLCAPRWPELLLAKVSSPGTGPAEAIGAPHQPGPAMDERLNAYSLLPRIFSDEESARTGGSGDTVDWRTRRHSVPVSLRFAKLLGADLTRVVVGAADPTRTLVRVQVPASDEARSSHLASATAVAGGEMSLPAQAPGVLLGSGLSTSPALAVVDGNRPRPTDEVMWAPAGGTVTLSLAGYRAYPPTEHEVGTGLLWKLEDATLATRGADPEVVVGHWDGRGEPPSFQSVVAGTIVGADDALPYMMATLCTQLNPYEAPADDTLGRSDVIVAATVLARVAATYALCGAQPSASLALCSAPGGVERIAREILGAAGIDARSGFVPLDVVALGVPPWVQIADGQVILQPPVSDGAVPEWAVSCATALTARGLRVTARLVELPDPSGAGDVERLLTGGWHGPMMVEFQFGACVQPHGGGGSDTCDHVAAQVAHLTGAGAGTLRLPRSDAAVTGPGALYLPGAEGHPSVGGSPRVAALWLLLAMARGECRGLKAPVGQHHLPPSLDGILASDRDLWWAEAAWDRAGPIPGPDPEGGWARRAPAEGGAAETGAVAPYAPYETHSCARTPEQHPPAEGARATASALLALPPPPPKAFTEFRRRARECVEESMPLIATGSGPVQHAPRGPVPALEPRRPRGQGGGHGGFGSGLGALAAPGAVAWADQGPDEPPFVAGYGDLEGLGTSDVGAAVRQALEVEAEDLFVGSSEESDDSAGGFAPVPEPEPHGPDGAAEGTFEEGIPAGGGAPGTWLGEGWPALGAGAVVGPDDRVRAGTGPSGPVQQAPPLEGGPGEAPLGIDTPRG